MRDPVLNIVSFVERQSYRPLWELQKQLWRARYEGRVEDTLLLLEHDPVFTLGRNSNSASLLLSEAAYAERGAELVEVDRGGDVTYHGPGQLVGYWIFDLREWHMDVHRYLRGIEEVLIATLARFGVEGSRSEGATGVWAGDEKVAAIGMHLSHWVSTHGFALNIDPDLAPFGWIVPCGLVGRGVTSMRKLTDRSPGRDSVESAIVEETARVFGRRPMHRTLGQVLSGISQPEGHEMKTKDCLV